MDRDVFSELVALMTGNADVNQHTNYLVDVLKDSIQKTYIDKFDAVMEEYRQRCKNDMCNQIQLLEAMKPFFDNQQQGQIEQLEQMMTNMNALNSLMYDVKLATEEMGNNESDQSRGQDIGYSMARGGQSRTDSGNLEQDQPGENLGSGMLDQLPMMMLLGFLFMGNQPE